MYVTSPPREHQWLPRLEGGEALDRIAVTPLGRQPEAAAGTGGARAAAAGTGGAERGVPRAPRQKAAGASGGFGCCASRPAVGSGPAGGGEGGGGGGGGGEAGAGARRKEVITAGVA